MARRIMVTIITWANHFPVLLPNVAARVQRYKRAGGDIEGDRQSDQRQAGGCQTATQQARTAGYSGYAPYISDLDREVDIFAGHMCGPETHERSTW